jgi:rSAM/selenodomain-associated transferase 1
MSYQGRGLIIFIKNPVLGSVKTRLARTIGNEEALNVYQLLLQCTRDTVLQLNGIQLHLFYSDVIDIADQWENQFFYKNVQSGEDLGQKMSRAFKEILAINEHVLIIGSDCPYLTPAMIDNAFEQLADHDLVIGPAKDGGYYLLGMKNLMPEIFHKVAWSTQYVFQQTLDIAERLGKSCYILEELSDIDDWEDWVAFVGG